MARQESELVMERLCWLHSNRPGKRERISVGCREIRTLANGISLVVLDSAGGNLFYTIKLLLNKSLEKKMKNLSSLFPSSKPS